MLMQRALSAFAASPAANSRARSKRTRTFSACGTVAGTMATYKKHMINVDRTKQGIHDVIVYCKANLDKKVIDAVDAVLRGK